MDYKEVENNGTVVCVNAIPATSRRKALSSVPKDSVWNIASQKKLDVRLLASSPGPCFKNLISENSELQPRSDEEIGPGRLNDFS